MVNPVWVWNAVRGRSVTFAALCTLTLAGCSVYHWLRDAAAWLGAPGWLLWAIPPAIAGAISSREEDWLPDPARRKRIALILLLAGILPLALGLGLEKWTQAPAQKAANIKN